LTVFKHTTEDLAARAGRSVSTIFAWQRSGFFAGIRSSKVGGRGKGVARLWPDEALTRVDKILELMDKGYDAKLIAERFKPEEAPEGASGDGKS
jgi:hypothetical protein